MKLEQTGELAPANKPWQLIRDAIADLTLQEQTEGVAIDMDEWHVVCGATCFQCLSGTAMSRRLGVGLGDIAAPRNFPEDVARRLEALDWFRRGRIRDAYKLLGLEGADGASDWRVADYYCYDPEPFKQDMLDLADYLEEHYPGIVTT